jgi:hypothetical protein
MAFCRIVPTAAALKHNARRRAEILLKHLPATSEALLADYRKRAKEVRALADKAETASQRKAILRIADTWNELAAEQEARLRLQRADT